MPQRRSPCTSQPISTMTLHGNPNGGNEVVSVQKGDCRDTGDSGSHVDPARDSQHEVVEISQTIIDYMLVSFGQTISWKIFLSTFLNQLFFVELFSILHTLYCIHLLINSFVDITIIYNRKFVFRINFLQLFEMDHYSISRIQLYMCTVLNLAVNKKKRSKLNPPMAIRSRD